MSTHTELSDDDVNNAADNNQSIKRVPGVYEVVLEETETQRDVIIIPPKSSKVSSSCMNNLQKYHNQQKEVTVNKLWNTIKAEWNTTVTLDHNNNTQDDVQTKSDVQVHKDLW